MTVGQCPTQVCTVFLPLTSLLIQSCCLDRGWAVSTHVQPFNISSFIIPIVTITLFTSQDVSHSCSTVLDFDLYPFPFIVPHLFITPTASEHFCLNYLIDPIFIGLDTILIQCYSHSSPIASQFIASPLIWVQLIEMFSGCLSILFLPLFYSSHNYLWTP